MGTVALEVGLLLAVLSPPAMRLLCAIAVPFHVAVFATFGISPFTSNLLAYAVLVPWGKVVEPLARSPLVRSLTRSSRPARLSHLLPAAIGVGVVEVIVGNPFERLLGLAFGSGRTVLYTVECALALAVAAGYLVVRVRRLGWPRDKVLAGQP